ncbi:MAG: phosphonoacetaldehyde hydrolase [Cellvibrio sp. 79]|nr:MAG: phosphonoacetaldehyde hydrolase [Cellvibrio sp. 79]
MLEAIIFDWAGTLVDHGSRAPLKAFVELFAEQDIEITLAEAREPMGTEKRLHICRLLQQPRIQQAWITRHGRLPTEAEIDTLYQRLVPLQREQIELHTKLIPGTLDMLAAVRARGLKIGTTTGYGRAMIDNLLIAAAEQGFVPDCVVAADEVPATRPAATAALANLVQLGVSAVQHCVKVDDTAPGISEGRNAGMWTVAVVLSGNAVGLGETELQQLSSEARKNLRNQAYRSLEQTGAHYFIDSVADLPDVLADIERRLARNEKP